jgi:hypothetical protein
MDQMKKGAADRGKDMRKQTILAELTQKPTCREPYQRRGATDRDSLIARIMQLKNELRATEHILRAKYGEEVEV